MDYASLVETQRSFFLTHATLSLEFRQAQLGKLKSAIEAHETELLDALHADLHKPPQEAYASEIGMVLSEIREAQGRLPRWLAPRRGRMPLFTWPGSARIVPQPYGTALIIGPWNYPFQLLFAPLVGAIAAGNCACLKASELAPHTSAVMAKLIRATFPPHYIAVVEGGLAAAQALLEQRFDFIFFTGSSKTGRAVMTAAARHLTPVTLELGGKSPCIVCADSSMEMAARRITWGKCMNAGQTCVAPDFILVEKTVRESLVQALRKAMVDFYGANPRSSPDYGRIVNQVHFDRLVGYLGDGTIAHGGQHDAEELYVAPTILTDVPWNAPVMQEEIFGPILPVMEFGDLDEALALLRTRPEPLALYLFTNNSKSQQRIVAETRSGGICFNDTVIQLLGKDLPFGGVGESGMGAYHGKAGFDCFTHYKAVVRSSTWFDRGFSYPPFRQAFNQFKRFFQFSMRG